jgi:hypothetical protein
MTGSEAGEYEYEYDDDDDYETGSGAEEWEGDGFVQGMAGTADERRKRKKDEPMSPVAVVRELGRHYRITHAATPGVPDRIFALLVLADPF